MINNWDEAINSLRERKPFGFGSIPDVVYERAIAWMESRRQTNPDQPPTCCVAFEGLIIDFRNEQGDLELSAEFGENGKGELMRWSKARVVASEPIPQG